MSLLPTAHAGQSFGARRIDFYTVSGEVSGSDDGTGRVTDTDGMAHDVRLLERSNALAPGDTASVLRVQAGPNRRSRPAAIVNHTRGTWMRAAPDATGLLSRSGVTRGFNWWLSVLALALVAIAAVWPAIHGFLTEVNAGLMASIPAFDVYAEIAAILPGLSGWRLETALPSGLLDGLASLGFIPMGQLTEWGLGLGAGLLALLSFLGRSWRLVYIPALAALALATGAILGAALPTLAVIGGSLLFFMLGGLVNRIRDGGRFNARVARLAEHALRNPPQESVRASDTSDAAKAGVTASAAIAAATATAEGHDETIDAEPADTASEVGEDTSLSTQAEPAPVADNDASADDTAQGENDGSGEDDGSGEAEAPAQDDLLPAAPTSDTNTDIAADAAEPEAAGEVEAVSEVAVASDLSEVEASVSGPGDSGNDESVAGIDMSADSESSDGEAAAVPAATSPIFEADAAEAPTAETGAEAAPETGTELATDAETEIAAVTDDGVEPETEIAAATTEAGADAADTEIDDDLPSLDDVAAAAALTAVETSEPDGDTPENADAVQAAVDLDDERTMPVAPPPPMPGDDAVEARANAEPAIGADAGPDTGPNTGLDTGADTGAETAAMAEPAESTDDSPAPDADATGEAAPLASADESAVAPPVATHEASEAPATPIIDDPLMDEGVDPMMSSEGKTDYAPGAPDIDLDRTPVGQN